MSNVATNGSNSLNMNPTLENISNSEPEVQSAHNSDSQQNTSSSSISKEYLPLQAYIQKSETHEQSALGLNKASGPEEAAEMHRKRVGKNIEDLGNDLPK